MGCDIHGYIETRENGTWKIAGGIPDVRSYNSFSVLFGVRQLAIGKPMADNRGFPEYTEGELEAIEAWEEGNHCWHDSPGLHSFSWFTAEDVIDYDWEQEFEDTRGTTGASWPAGPSTFVPARSLLHDNWLEVIDRMLEFASKNPPEDIRVVAWFDN